VTPVTSNDLSAGILISETGIDHSMRPAQSVAPTRSALQNQLTAQESIAILPAKKSREKIRQRGRA
jgi:hypothetical protein